MIVANFSYIGKRIRINKILKDGKAVVFAFDHGFEHGPRDFPRDRVNPKDVVKIAVKNEFDGIMTTRGVARATYEIWGNNIPLILKVTSKTSLRPKDPQLLQSPIGTVEDAIALDADAVAATVYWGSPYEDIMIKKFVEISEECEKFGLPILMLAYPRGPTIPNRNDPEVVRYAARAGAELGADMIKTHYTGSVETFREVVRASPVPVMMSGGPRQENPGDFLRVVRNVMDAGAAGVVVGRNVFQSPNPDKISRAIIKIVHDDISLEEALRLL